ncbi:MAG: S8 family serine peptidase, partial [Candidatus Aenigmarchaeota archaeon]|nr:S8 family serine peptidase [Candidatus Aenigmarchaeota archaeon]
MDKSLVLFFLLIFSLLLTFFLFSFFHPPKTGYFVEEKAKIPEELSDEDIFLHLKAGKFDPLKKEIKVKGLDIESFPEDQENYYIVQLKGPIEKEWKNQLKQLNLEIIDYIPDYTYLVKMRGSLKNQLKNLNFVRWVGIFQPSYKVDPKLLEERFEEKLMKGKKEKNVSEKVEVKILLFNSDDVSNVRKEIKKLGGSVIDYGNKFIIASLKKSDIASIALIPSVKWIEEHLEPKLFLDVSARIISAPVAWNLGINGSGINVSVIDSGVDTGNLTTIHPDLRGRVVALKDYTETNDSDGIAEDFHGHGTHVAGTILGNGTASNRNYTGIAPAANLIVQKAFNDIGFYSGPSDYEVLFNDSFNLKAVISSNSWGANTYGDYTSIDAEVDDSVRKYNLTIIFAAGNSGPCSLSTSSPANAKNVIAVGATENNKSYVISDYPGYCDNPNQVAFFSSRGPTEDGRTKPDIVAPGTAILAPKSTLASDQTYEPYGGVVKGNGGDYGYLAGTSMAAPHVAGVAALITQKYFETFGKYPSPALVKAMIINGADDIGYEYPSYIQGWGRVNVNKTLFETTTRRIILKEENTSLATYNYSAYKFRVDNASELRITLVWTDVPGSPLTSKALVNDLDLIVVSPRRVYRGNDFTFPFDDSSDNLNNVENVFIKNPETGNYTIIVYASNIPNETQRYALVISGNVSELALTPNEDIFPPTVKNIMPGSVKTSFGTLVRINATVQDDKEVSRVWLNYSRNGIT